MGKVIKIGDKEIEVKENYTVTDHIKSVKKPELQEGIQVQIRMINHVSINPKLSIPEILKMNWGDFQRLYTELSKIYGIPSAFSFLGSE